MQQAPPSSFRREKLSAKASRTASNPGRANPWMVTWLISRNIKTSVTIVKAMCKPSAHMASEIEVNANPDSLSAGTIMGDRRSGAPIASTFHGASMASTLWLKRRLRTGY